MTVKVRPPATAIAMLLFFLLLWGLSILLFLAFSEGIGYIALGLLFLLAASGILTILLIPLAILPVHADAAGISYGPPWRRFHLAWIGLHFFEVQLHRGQPISVGANSRPGMRHGLLLNGMNARRKDIEKIVTLAEECLGGTPGEWQTLPYPDPKQEFRAFYRAGRESSSYSEKGHEAPFKR